MKKNFKVNRNSQNNKCNSKENHIKIFSVLILGRGKRKRKMSYLILFLKIQLKLLLLIF